MNTKNTSYNSKQDTFLPWEGFTCAYCKKETWYIYNRIQGIHYCNLCRDKYYCTSICLNQNKSSHLLVCKKKNE